MNDFNKEPEFGTEQPTQAAPNTTDAPVTADPVEAAAEPLPSAEPPQAPEMPHTAPAEPHWSAQPGAPAQEAPVPPYPYPVHAHVDGPTATYIVDLPKKKRRMPTGLKVLIICMCVLFGTASLGLLGYGMFSFVTNVVSFGQDIVDEFTIPEFSDPYDFGVNPDDGEKDRIPDKTPDNGQEGSVEQGEIVIPDIDVTPNTDGIRLHAAPNTAELDITEVYDKVIRSTVLVLVTAESGTGSGTGIIATQDGYIITNSHVVLNTRNVAVQVKMHDGTTHDAVVVGFDKTTDLAVLKIEGTGYTPAEFADSDDLRMGQWVIAIGNPGGEQFSGSITRGVVSGLDRSVGTYSANGMTYIQTDAAINPGNSGGPLVNLYGQVVGINSSKIVSDEYEGMGFAIPITGAKKIIDDLLSGGYVEGRVRFGIKGTEVTQMQAYMSGVPQGFMISEIDADSCFVGTDVQAYDIITAVDGVETPTLDALSNALLNYTPGDTATVTLFRPNESGTGGEEFEVKVTLLADLGETQN